MSEYKEIKVPKDYPVRGIRSFVEMLPEDMDSIKEPLLLMCDGVVYDVLMLVATANEELKAAYQNNSNEVEIEDSIEEE